MSLIFFLAGASCTPTPDPFELTAESLVNPPTPVVPSKLPPSLLPTAETLLNNPPPAPPFVDSLEPGPSAVVERPRSIHFAIVESGLWEPGDTSEELVRRVRSSLRFTLDGQVVPLKKDLLIATGMLIRKYDDRGEFLGSHGGHVETSVPVNLAEGLHVATVEVSTRSDAVRSYSWVFRVK